MNTALVIIIEVFSVSNWVNNLFQASQAPFHIIVSAWCYLHSRHSWVIDTSQGRLGYGTCDNQVSENGGSLPDLGQAWEVTRSQGPLVNGLIKTWSQKSRQGPRGLGMCQCRLPREVVALKPGAQMSIDKIANYPSKWSWIWRRTVINR